MQPNRSSKRNWQWSWQSSHSIWFFALWSEVSLVRSSPWEFTMPRKSFSLWEICRACERPWEAQEAQLFSRFVLSPSEFLLWLRWYLQVELRSLTSLMQATSDQENEWQWRLQFTPISSRTNLRSLGITIIECTLTWTRKRLPSREYIGQKKPMRFLSIKRWETDE